MYLKEGEAREDKGNIWAGMSGRTMWRGNPVLLVSQPSGPYSTKTIVTHTHKKKERKGGGG